MSCLPTSWHSVLGSCLQLLQGYIKHAISPWTMVTLSFYPNLTLIHKAASPSLASHSKMSITTAVQIKWFVMRSVPTTHYKKNICTVYTASSIERTCGLQQHNTEAKFYIFLGYYCIKLNMVQQVSIFQPYLSQQKGNMKPYLKI